MATTLRLLIVEDQPYDAEMAVAALEGTGYACQWQRVETRDAFVGYLQTAEYDLILADYSLPTFDGMAALRLFLASGLDIPFIFLSGTVGEGTAIDSLKAGATDYVMKNRLERLAPVVQRALQEREAQRQRQQAEEQRRRMEQMYHQILDAMTDLVMVKDPRSRIIWANKAFCDYSGLTKEHLCGRLDPLGDPQEAAQRSIQDDTSVLSTGQLLDLPEAPLTRYDGQVRLFHTVKSPIFDTQGHVSQLVAVCRDITERRQAEANRHALEEQLFQAQKMESIGTLAAGVAHDFNNLLSVILSNIDLMRDAIHPHDTRLRTWLANIESAAERAATLTRQMAEPQRLPIVANDVVSAPLYGTETLLVAEDEDTMRMLAYTALTRLGYTVLLARDGQEAVQVYTEHQERIALLILDVIMPRQGGRETYTQIRALGSTVPVLFVTGYSPELARGALVACADATVLQKPYSIRTLGHTVRELLDRAA